MKAILTNWKTTVAGCIGVLITAEQVIQSDLGSGVAIPWKSVLVTFAISVGLILAKDI